MMGGFVILKRRENPSSIQADVMPVPFDIKP
jgi:hypothetical protein